MKFFNFLSLIFDSVFRFRFRDIVSVSGFRIPCFGAVLCFNIDVTFYVLEIRVSWIKTLRSASVSIPLHEIEFQIRQKSKKRGGGGKEGTNTAKRHRNTGI